MTLSQASYFQPVEPKEKLTSLGRFSIKLRAKLYSGFQLNTVNLITRDINNSVNQSELEAIPGNRRQARGNARVQLVIGLVLFLIGYERLAPVL